MSSFVRRISRCLAALSLGVTLALTAGLASAQERYASIVVDADTMTVLHARNAEAPRFPASLTKVMTLYLLFDALRSGQLQITDQITMSAHAASMQPSKLGIRAGGTISVQDAIEALIAKSANDVAVAIAERLGGTESRFAALMTVKARSLGMISTRFTNASGLPDREQVTTALDMARLADSIMIEHSHFYNYFSIGQMDWEGQRFPNHNRLLGRVQGVDGIKTGYTRASGFNLMAAARRDGRRVIAVVLGGSTARERDDHMAELLEAAFVAIDSRRSQLFASIDSGWATAQLAVMQPLPVPGSEDSTEEPWLGYEEGSVAQ
jgi:D-alanyl-D-alanine carboxypeptidase